MAVFCEKEIGRCDRQNNSSHSLILGICEYVVTWQRGISGAEGIKLAHHLTLK